MATFWDKATPAQRAVSCLLFLGLVGFMIGLQWAMTAIMSRTEWPVPARLVGSLLVSMIPAVPPPAKRRCIMGGVFGALWAGTALSQFGPLAGIGGHELRIAQLVAMAPLLLLAWVGLRQPR